MLAKEVMRRDVITVRPETTVVDIADLLLSHNISAVPVVDGEDRLWGIVSEADILHRAEIGTEPQHTWWENLFTGHEQQAAEFLKVHGVQASHVMTRELVTAREDTPLTDIVALFDRFRVRRVLIVENDRLAGVVSQSDVLRPLAALKRRASKADTSDPHIRLELDKLLHNTVWSTVTPLGYSIGFDVDGGIIRLTGTVGSEAEREALCMAAAAIPGVQSIQAELALLPRGISAI